MAASTSDPVNVRKKGFKLEAGAGKRVCKTSPCAFPELLELSVIVGCGDADVDIGLLPVLHCFLKEKCQAGICTTQRGGRALLHLHFQMVCRLSAVSAKSVDRSLIRQLGWHLNSPPKAFVRCKVLTKKSRHTFQCMIGRCLKDYGKEHFLMVTHNLSEDELEFGRESYAKLGLDDLKKKVCLTPENVFERCWMYHTFYKNRMQGNSMPVCLLSMLRTGNYYPAAAWITPAAGQGMDAQRVAALWCCLLAPSSVSLEDIHKIFFNRYYDTDRYVVSATRRTNHDPVVSKTSKSPESARSATVASTSAADAPPPSSGIGTAAPNDIS
ncbi:hypothetical protein O6H91_02G115400 [Diphasiastrum complanatum]|uniref:Uncharacterized protein n=1 Tax=Diphasiastrum complanatum TaxID=34168 RepID=A0ACC2EK03_DIPCM|nr:hypothetical protein O6H91_02G115400 [Diphasiastrum complanatum]